MKIAVIGSGISGLSAAHTLSGHHSVTIYEKDHRLGGHSCTVDVDYYGPSIAVDVGFIIYNRTTYPNLTALFRRYGVKSAATKMSFSISMDDGKFEWGTSGLNMLFAQRANALNPIFYALLLEILRFFAVAKFDLANNSIGNESIGDYLNRRKFSNSLAERFLIPMGASIWSASADEFLRHPAIVLLGFLENHKLLGLRQPPWLTVSGGARNYVEKLVASTNATVLKGVAVQKVKRTVSGVSVTDANGNDAEFDHVILACHAPEALRILDEPRTREIEVLGAFKYSRNLTVLHGDRSVMPERRAAWASWNYKGYGSGRGDESGVNITYWMNSLQRIDERYPLFVSLNPTATLDKNLIFGEFDFEHPQFDASAIEAQRNLHSIQGTDNIWYCGAYTGHGFHEDGIRSGLEIAQKLDATIEVTMLGHSRIFA